MGLTSRIKGWALELGFDLVGVSPAGPLPESAHLGEWLAEGYEATMGYMSREPERRGSAAAVLTGAMSVISCALNYNTDRPYSVDALERGRGWVSRYAWGDDYHGLVKERLGSLARRIESAEAGVETVLYVDTGPVLERLYASYAGLGWTGKNTCLINQSKGSWLFIGEIITDLELEYDSPAPDRCGTCTRCIDACPTDAILEPYVLDSARCISYLTIELKGPVPRELRDAMGSHIYGCDICQDVCPWNTRAPVTDERAFVPRPLTSAGAELFNPELRELAGLDEERFRHLFGGSPVKRAKRRGLLRNLLVAMGNSGREDLVPEVTEATADSDPLVRAHAVWALWKLRGERCRGTLEDMRGAEAHPMVLEEIEAAIGRPALGGPGKRTERVRRS